MTDAPLTRRLAAVMIADVIGYSRMLAENEQDTLSALRQLWSATVNPLVAMHHGRIFKTMGDGVMAEFASAVDAVGCALAIQRSLDDGGAIALRIGVNLGEIVSEDDDIFGDGVNVAARLEREAPRRGVLISDVVHAQVKGKIDAVFASGGEMRFKNIDRSIGVWRWSPDELPQPSATRSPPSPKPSLAIFPFANLSHTEEAEALADGLVEDIITTLSKLSGLTVIARNSTFAYKGGGVDLRQAARALGARYALEGSVRKGGERFRIAAQLIDSDTGALVWAERYDRSVDDIFALQDEITLMLARELQVTLVEGEQARLRYSTITNIAAWNLWVQGLTHYRSGIVAPHGMGRARGSWERALELAPDSAAIHAMLGLLDQGNARFSWAERDSALESGEQHVAKALALDPENPDAHVVSALLLNLRRRFDESVAAAQRAIALAPGSADIAAFSASVFACADLGAEAIIQIERAMRLSPISPTNYYGMKGFARRAAGHLDQALSAYKEYAARSPGFAHADLAILYQLTGDSGRARAEIAEHLAARPSARIGSWEATQFRKNLAQVDEDRAALRAAGLPE